MPVTPRAVLLSAVGCGSNSNHYTMDQNQAANQSHPDSAQMAYELTQQQWCSNDQACSLVLEMFSGKDEYNNFNVRLVALDRLALADTGWDITADEPVNKGTLAFMLCRGMNIEGGLLMRVFPSRRYAYREAVYHGLMQRGSEWEPLTGPEVVGIIGRAARQAEIMVE